MDLHQIAGQLTFQDGICFPVKPVFANDTIFFLGSLSSKIRLGIKEKKLATEFSYFSLWARERNLRQLAEPWKSSNTRRRVGRGLSFHIAPSNVPSNTLFSLAFGLLSGNSVALRIPSRVHSNHPFLLFILKEELTKHPEVNELVSLHAYSRTNYQITEYLSARSQSRVIWGGDDTVQQVRSFKTPPSALDLSFPDRTSIAVVSLETLENLSDRNIQVAVSALAKDIQVFDQNACSSPRAIFIIADHENEALNSNLFQFFKLLDQSSQSIPTGHFSRAQAHISSASQLALTSQLDIIYAGKFCLAFKLVSSRCCHSIVKTARNGLLPVVITSDLSLVKDLIPSNVQTCVVLGENLEIQKSLNELTSQFPINRIVRPGMALSMDLFWDGHDIIGSLSRVVSCV